MAKPKNLKLKIIELRQLGKSYDEISELLNCSKSSVAYHLSDGEKEKHTRRRNKYRKGLHPLTIKVSKFNNRVDESKGVSYKPNNQSIVKIVYKKILNFCRGSKMQITVEQVLEKIGPNPVCYLTGKPIDLSKSSSYHLDHKVPITRGGTNDLDNLGLASSEANLAKRNMTNEEFIELCKAVARHNS